jgi:DNA-binding transcriptional LysR family regulator
VSRAADKLDMAVQTVSAQVRELERSLATPCSNQLGVAWC